VVGKNGVVEDPGACPNRGLAVSKRIPGNSQPWGEVLQGGSIVVGLADGRFRRCCRIAPDVTQQAVDLGGRPAGFIAHSHIHGEVGGKLEVVLNIKSHDPLARAPLGFIGRTQSQIFNWAFRNPASDATI